MDPNLPSAALLLLVEVAVAVAADPVAPVPLPVVVIILPPNVVTANSDTTTVPERDSVVIAVETDGMAVASAAALTVPGVKDATRTQDEEGGIGCAVGVGWMDCCQVEVP